jgi:xanthine dehydrogenase accessory factor
MPCASNGALELFIQPTLPAPAVLVLGSTPTALEACVLVQRVGLRVCAAANVTAPLAALGLPRVIQGFDVAAFEAIKPLLVLVATQGDGDEEALEAALRSTAAAVLLVASQRKADRLRDTMRLRGIAPAKHVLDYGGERFYFCCDGCKQEFDRQPAKYLAIVQAKAHLEKT